MDGDGDDDDNGHGYAKNGDLTIALMHDDGNCDVDIMMVMMRMVVTTLAVMMTIMRFAVLMLASRLNCAALRCADRCSVVGAVRCLDRPDLYV